MGVAYPGMHMSSCLQLELIIISKFLCIINHVKFYIIKPQKLGSLAYGTFIKKYI
jgi:hypothetical protein